jgi:ABC-type antimicrobial peptide transport system permease subunit
MKERLMFAFIAGIVGCLVGSALAFAIRKGAEPFPAYIVLAVTVIFAVCGGLAKRKWVDAVLDFIAHVWP